MIISSLSFSQITITHKNQAPMLRPPSNSRKGFLGINWHSPSKRPSNIEQSSGNLVVSTAKLICDAISRLARLITSWLDRAMPRFLQLTVSIYHRLVIVRIRCNVSSRLLDYITVRSCIASRAIAHRFRLFTAQRQLICDAMLHLGRLITSRFVCAIAPPPPPHHPVLLPLCDLGNSS